MKSDADIRRDVEAELDWDPRFDSHDIGVAVKNGVVTLSGHVNSYPGRWAAQKSAQGVAGVTAVANELKVMLPSDKERLDSDIASDAVSALAASSSVPAKEIKLAVQNGWITLQGAVPYWYQKNTVERIVGHIRGVKGVSNAITIKPLEPKVAITDVKKKIADAFHRHAELDAAKVRIELDKDDSITLAGEVHSWLEREQAEFAAWAAPGVRQVKNQLVIRP